MKLPRLNLGWLMIGVALFAIHLAIVQKMMSWPAPVIHDLILGAVPMAALVAIGTVLIYTRRMFVHSLWARDVRLDGARPVCFTRSPLQ